MDGEKEKSVWLCAAEGGKKGGNKNDASRDTESCGDVDVLAVPSSPAVSSPKAQNFSSTTTLLYTWVD